jgi:hypothetical protein
MAEYKRQNTGWQNASQSEQNARAPRYEPRYQKLSQSHE